MFSVNIKRISRKSCGALPRVRGVWLCAFALLILAVPKGLVAQTGSFVPQGIHRIKHVIIIMQENRSFNSYLALFREPKVCRRRMVLLLPVILIYEQG